MILFEFGFSHQGHRELSSSHTGTRDWKPKDCFCFIPFKWRPTSELFLSFSLQLFICWSSSLIWSQHNRNETIRNFLWRDTINRSSTHYVPTFLNHLGDDSLKFTSDHSNLLLFLQLPKRYRTDGFGAQSLLNQAKASYKWRPVCNANESGYRLSLLWHLQLKVLQKRHKSKRRKCHSRLKLRQEMTSSKQKNKKRSWAELPVSRSIRTETLLLINRRRVRLQPATVEQKTATFGCACHPFSVWVRSSPSSNWTEWKKRREKQYRWDLERLSVGSSVQREEKITISDRVRWLLVGWGGSISVDLTLWTLHLTHKRHKTQENNTGTNVDQKTKK